MAKLSKQFYYTSQGEKKVNCYRILIPKEILNNTDINENTELKIYVKDGKIIVEKV